MRFFWPEVACAIPLIREMLAERAAKTREVIFYLKCNGRQSARAPYRFFLGNASRHSAGTHLSAMTQKSRHGGTPV